MCHIFIKILFFKIIKFYLFYQILIILITQNYHDIVSSLQVRKNDGKTTDLQIDLL